MFFANFHIERPSDTPGVLQALVNTNMTALNMISFGLGLLSPLNYITMMVKMNRSLAEVWRPA
jgi:hypothetical protein